MESSSSQQMLRVEVWLKLGQVCMEPLGSFCLILLEMFLKTSLCLNELLPTTLRLWCSRKKKKKLVSHGNPCLSFSGATCTAKMSICQLGELRGETVFCFTDLWNMTRRRIVRTWLKLLIQIHWRCGCAIRILWAWSLPWALKLLDFSSKNYCFWLSEEIWSVCVIVFSRLLWFLTGCQSSTCSGAVHHCGGVHHRVVLFWRGQLLLVLVSRNCSRQKHQESDTQHGCLSYWCKCSKSSYFRKKLWAVLFYVEFWTCFCWHKIFLCRETLWLWLLKSPLWFCNERKKAQQRVWMKRCCRDYVHIDPLQALLPSWRLELQSHLEPGRMTVS